MKITVCRAKIRLVSLDVIALVKLNQSRQYENSLKLIVVVVRGE